LKEGTLYAGRVKKVFAKLRQSAGETAIPESDDPVLRLAVAILGIECGDSEADLAIKRLLTTMVDWNEVRVSSVEQVLKAMGDRIPQGPERAQQLINALQAIYEREHRISLDRLRNIGRREAHDYLLGLDGVDDYGAASVMLWSFGGHAIPVSDPLLRSLRDAELVHPAATRAEIQAFLERNVNAAQAKEFCLVMRSFSGHKKSASRSTKPARKKSVSK